MPEDDYTDDLLALLAPCDPAPRRPARGQGDSRRPGGGPPAAGSPAVAARPVPSAPVAAAPIAVGRRFHPVPGAPLTAPDGVLVTERGTAVHAVVAGRIEVEAGGVLRLRADDGVEIRYEGVTPASALTSGSRVPPGAVLGVVDERARLGLRVRDAGGADLDVAAVLLGLPDPNDLGYAAVGTGIGVDPDALDRALAAAARP